jgi:putative aldouronate transport system permease protein
MKSIKGLKKRLNKNWELYIFVLPAVIYLIIFNYFPMYGVIIAFKDFKPINGIVNSSWVGLEHFIRFFTMNKFIVVFQNTITLSLYTLIAAFPFPIILALLLNSCPYNRFKKVVQVATYAPHFISIVVIVGMINVFFSPTYGLIGNLLRAIGLIDGPYMILTNAKAFSHLYVWSGIWQSVGWNSIIYLGALSGIDPTLHESAVIDGANKLQRILHIDLPGIIPTIVILLILNFGRVMNVGFEKVFLMQNSMNLAKSEIINTYIYKMGIMSGQFSFASAIGLFNSVINFVLLISVNKIADILGENALW